MMFLDCPACLDQDGALRCGLPAEVRCRFTMRSTDGPVESAMIRCPAGHYFCGPIESFTWDGKDRHDPGSAAVTARAGRDSVQGGHDGRNGTDGSAVRHFPAEAERRHRRPNTAPAYYLGHPAALWITIMRPRRRPAAARYPAGPGDLVTPPASAVPRSHHVGLLWAAWAMITPGHGQSRTKASRSGPADLPRPGQKGVIRPLPAHTSGGGTLPGPESLAGGRPDLRASISVKPSGGGT